MKAIIRDAKQRLKQPKNLAILASLAVASAFAISIFGYVPSRRVVLPSLIFLLGKLAWRIGTKRLRNSFSASVAKDIGAFNMGAGVLLLIASLVDNIWFSDLPQFLFVGLVAREVFITFQVSRLDERLMGLPKEDVAVITESSDVAIARLRHRDMAITSVLKKYDAIDERFGLTKKAVTV